MGSRRHTLARSSHSCWCHLPSVCLPLRACLPCFPPAQAHSLRSTSHSPCSRCGMTRRGKNLVSLTHHSLVIESGVVPRRLVRIGGLHLAWEVTRSTSLPTPSPFSSRTSNLISEPLIKKSLSSSSPSASPWASRWPWPTPPSGGRLWPRPWPSARTQPLPRGGPRGPPAPGPSRREGRSSRGRGALVSGAAAAAAATRRSPRGAKTSRRPRWRWQREGSPTSSQSRPRATSTLRLDV